MTPSRTFVRVFATAFLGSAVLLPVGRAEVKVTPVFGDHMVLQREMATPIYGTAEAGEQVTVKFRDQEKTTTAGADGKWVVKLDKLKVGGPDELTIGTLTIKDVLVGDVWIGSGQSNMEIASKGFMAGDPVLAKIVADGPYPQLRIFSTRGKKIWEEATPQTLEYFSALLFSFGLPLQKEIGVPVGLMSPAVGGTPSGYWLSEEAYRSDAACKAAAEKFAQTYDFDAAKAKYDRDLADWKAAAEAAKSDGKPAPRGPNAPAKAGESTGKIGNLYEAHVRPMVGFGIRGVLWDQGEAGTAITGVDQYTLMGALIRGWRQEWGQNEFPFLYVEKPSGEGCAWDPTDPVTNKASPFAPLPAQVPPLIAGLYRETHIRIMQYPQTAMVTSSDLGNMTHPTNKSGYGLRAARVALGMVYGRKIEIYGPLYASHQIEGDKVRIRFSHTGQGLAAPQAQKLQGFAIAGEDQKFVWGDAVIDGDSVIVSSASVPKPAAVRYAWSQQIPWANLFNKDGLPAPAFRTDAWER
ncbi:MAG: sialate O-acetylesterase [Chthoniobacter sp.]|jgi:sialate O-acetylesterase|nr:sialate O-acetylesterase [Chthoniobacter sp.]